MVFQTAIRLLSAAVLLSALGAAAEAADAKAGRQGANVCQACHGLDGLSKNPEAPNLAGQLDNYLQKALTEYRDGTRKNETMAIVAKELSDTDIANLAAYYASIQIDVVPPQPQ